MCFLKIPIRSGRFFVGMNVWIMSLLCNWGGSPVKSSYVKTMSAINLDNRKHVWKRMVCGSLMPEVNVFVCKPVQGSIDLTNLGMFSCGL